MDQADFVVILYAFRSFCGHPFPFAGHRSISEDGSELPGGKVDEEDNTEEIAQGS
jgi:hypothetical protein